jgi:AraC-like DNA-binding protein
MKWNGEFVFGEGAAAYRGPSADNTFHTHVAIQLVLAETGLATVVAANGMEFIGASILIRPLVEHALSSRGEVTLLYAEPQSILTLHLAKLAPAADISVIEAGIVPERWSSESLDHWLVRIAGSIPQERAIDARLESALAHLAQEPGKSSIREAAMRCGLSESRLRVLARAQLGLPLSTWLIWRKLEHAARAISEGEPLSMAAVAGGFADQAHLARAMRRMFGITPRSAQLSALLGDNRSVQE